MLKECNISVSGDVVAHIHEMEKVIEENIDNFYQLKPRVKHWISASPATTSTLNKKYEVDRKSITTVPAFINPISDSKLSSKNIKKRIRSELKMSPTAVVVAGCGTVYWRKGPDIFLNVARKLLNISGLECQFLWVGDGPDFEEINSSLSEDERKNIRFIGSREDASQVLAAADIFFLSSREDPFPLVVMEAAQHSIPTVCFAEATGIVEFVKSDAGICVSKVDINKASSAIKVLINDSDLRKKLGSKAKERVFSEYTAEKQCLNIYSAIRNNTTYLPSVSVVVPFYNHEKFVVERVESIINQSVKDIDIIFMDDCSSDNTIKVVESYASDPRVKVHQNNINSGSPFKQWKKGMSLACSELIWIAEGDDSSSNNFLEVLLPYFDDPMMCIASAKTQIINEAGDVVEGALDPYLNSAYPEKFNQSYISDGFKEVNESLGAMCTLVNASGLLIRKASITEPMLNEAGQFKMCGDWYVYLSTLKRGRYLMMFVLKIILEDILPRLSIRLRAQRYTLMSE
ncbi:glycosyltransferase [Microbulbifer sp. ZKSA006]|uniref:glycosyltransferase n=1 Tax=Microbulbifer sp. ZKSA006 TaxID=3243390 RepID=UPI004039F3A0